MSVAPKPVEPSPQQKDAPHWYRDPGRVLRAYGTLLALLGAALGSWAIAAGSYRALKVPGQPIQTPDLLVPLHAVELAGGAFLFSLGALAGMALIVAAAGVVGGSLGFLFALPRMDPRPVSTAANGGTPPGVGVVPGDAPAPAGGASTFRHSPALNEIADWLTKIIVGLGLVQAENIYRGFVDIMMFLLRDAGLDRFPLAGIVVPACMLIGLIGGFLVAYLAMTLAVSPEIASAAYDLETHAEREARKAKKRADELAQDAEQSKLAADMAARNADERSRRAAEKETEARNRAEIVNRWRRMEIREIIEPFGTPRPQVLGDSERVFADQDVSMCTTVDERRAWAKLNAALDRRSEALRGYDLLVDDPILRRNAALEAFNIAQEAHYLAVAWRLPEMARIFEAVARTLEQKRPEALPQASRENLDLNAVNAALYEEPPESYILAGRLLDALAKTTPSAEQNGAFHVYRAAALGQEFSHLLELNTLTQPDRERIVQAAQAAIRRGIELGQREWLQYLADAAKSPLGAAGIQDNDLVELAKEPEIRTALGLG